MNVSMNKKFDKFKHFIYKSISFIAFGRRIMKLSTKGRYGTRAMIDIALYGDSGSSKLKDIAD